MFKKLLTVGALAAALIGGVGTASADGRTYNCEGTGITDKLIVGDSMWVVNPYKNFANVFKYNGSTWYFKGSIKDCGNGKWAGHYRR
ncbi:LCI fold-containing protein [Xenorhabdus anantnagensis]|uniref:LCI family antimicrobial peptide n=1 Tax=Xenorhabdus anantnagensis TaxID=3025875 RepID=A0ABT5LNF4_9GAMM|nr:LCI fold-containing protein [Xenorhabdus anantnagensis]MDC9595343.1 LCI family antimicrobial peptide [Xenorhabdus anantnagensis]